MPQHGAAPSERPRGGLISAGAATTVATPSPEIGPIRAVYNEYLQVVHQNLVISKRHTGYTAEEATLEANSVVSALRTGIDAAESAVKVANGQVGEAQERLAKEILLL